MDKCGFCGTYHEYTDGCPPPPNNWQLLMELRNIKERVACLHDLIKNKDIKDNDFDAEVLRVKKEAVEDGRIFIKL